MANKYGQTWWGKEWLKALTNIDWSNRLGRGKTYANKGAVLDFKINDNVISARVKGSISTPYKQSITIPLFDEATKEAIVDTLISTPSHIIQLLNGQLPKALKEISQTWSVRLFPESWSDFNMQCSCPDWAVPCKHLAAVIYLIANEIDKNPFIIFELHGLDLARALDQQGLSIHKQARQKIPCRTDFCQSEKPETPSVPTDTPFTLDISEISGQSTHLLELLSETTLFYRKSFKKVLTGSYPKTSRWYKKKREDFRPEKYTEYHAHLKKWDDLKLVIGQDGQLINAFGDGEEMLLDMQQIHLDKVVTLLGILETLPVADLQQYPNAIILLHSIYILINKLVAERNYIPRLLVNGEHYTMQWIPAAPDKGTKAILQKLKDHIPVDLLLLQDADGQLQYFKPEEQLNQLCALFLDYIVKSAQPYKEIPSVDENVYYCFFGFPPVRFYKLAEKKFPQSIHLWLRKFYVSDKRYTPVLEIEENESEEFRILLLIQDQENKNQPPIRFSKFLSQDAFKMHKYEVLKDLGLLAEHFPTLNTLISNREDYTDYYPSEDFSSILFNVLPILELLGITVYLPKSLRNLLHPATSVAITKGSGDEGNFSFMSVQNMLNFDWQIALGEDLLSKEDFLKLVRGKSGLVRYKDHYVQLDSKELHQLIRQIEKAPKLGANELMHATLSETYEGQTVQLDESIKKAIQEIQKIQNIPIPEGLKATLRPYQEVGYSWMYKNTQLGMGSLIADDMGLGKTLQVITLLLKFKEEGLFAKKQALIIVPTSLLTNWKKEIQKFAPSLDAVIYHGTNRTDPPKENEVIITTYGIARSDLAKFKKLRLHCIVIDEAQNIKNPISKQTKAIKAIKADFKIAMSGTPVENRLSEYWSIMDFSNKGYLGNLSQFSKKYARPIQKENNQDCLQRFRAITAPFILRRLKSDKTIIKDLPDKIESNYFAALGKDQTALYQKVVNNTMKVIKGEAEAFTRQGLVFKLMSALKQICNHPDQYLQKGIQEIELSGKAQLLFNLLDNIQAQKEKVLIFTQYKKMGDLLSYWIETRYNRSPLFLHGGNSRKQRDEMVERFQTNRQDNIFILSLKAGGTGLNLTAANHVIHYDLWWNPAVENQATDRAYRIGQKKNVMVYRLISKGTLEEKIDQMIQHKKDLADMAVSTGAQWIGDLSNEELQELIDLE